MLARGRAGRLGEADETRVRLWMYTTIGAWQEANRNRRWFDGAVKSHPSMRTLRRFGPPVVALGLGVIMLSAGIYGHIPGMPLWPRYLGLALVCVAMTLRHRAPVLGLLIGTVGMVADTWVGSSLATVAIYTDNIYAATVRGPRLTPRILLIASVAITVMAAAATYATASFAESLQIGALLAVVLFSPVTTGMIVREHRTRAELEHERAVLERDRAEKIAKLAEVDRRATLASERTRMARELHDTIANHFSAIAIQSSAVLSRTDMAPEAVKAVVAAIRADSVAGLAEMRRTIEFLRAGDGADDPIQHRLADLEDLVPRMEAAGLAVDVAVTGGDRELPIAVEFAAYRIIQEALTNVLKHGSHARVAVAYEAETLSITVDNRLPDAAAGVPGAGSGLLGMRERATILGGSFTAGPHLEGWRVTAALPITHLQESP